MVCPAASLLDAGQASHDAEAKDAAMVAGGHGAHCSAPRLAAKVPGRHCEHCVKLKNVPSGQGACAMPSEVATKPASTGVHRVAPATLLYVLLGQGRHTPAAVSWYEPAVHCTHAKVLLLAA